MSRYLKCFYSSMKGDFRDNNEDNLYSGSKWLDENHIDDNGVEFFNFTDKTKIFGVFDGLGGEYRGEAASFLAAKTLDEVNNPEKFFLAADAKVREIEGDSKSRAASTAALLWLDKAFFRTANLGDSRIYLIRGKEVRRLTVDHTMAETMISAGVLTEEETRKNSFQNYLTQCLGAEEDGQPVEISPFISEKERVNDGDVFLLCSDGLWGAVSAAEMSEFAASNSENPAVAISGRAYENGAKDNVTAMFVYVCKDSLFSKIKKLFMTKPKNNQ